MKWDHGSFLSSFIPLIQGSFPSFRPFSPQPLLSQLNIHVLFSPLFLLFPSPLCGCFSSVGFDLFAGNINIFKSFLICYFCTLFWNEVSWKGNMGCPIHCRGKLIVTWVGRLCMQLKPVLGKCWGVVPSTGLCAVSLVYIMKVHPRFSCTVSLRFAEPRYCRKGKNGGPVLKCLYVPLFWVVTKTMRSVILSDGNCDTNPWNSLGFFSLSTGTLRGHLCFITLHSLGVLSQS